MLSNMAASLILHKRISTTKAKAKALRGYVEPLITKSKDNTTESRRVVFSYLQNKEAVTELFKEVSAKIMNRPGGYTRILKTGFRSGDNAEMCIIELVDYNENMLGTAPEKAKTAKRSRRGGAKKKDEGADAAPKAEAKAKAPKAETKAKAPKVSADEAPATEENTTEKE
jgi:large subunit ribosomal protein L17